MRRFKLIVIREGLWKLEIYEISGVLRETLELNREEIEQLRQELLVL